MAEMNDILEVAKTTINASVNCNTVRGYIGWYSCNNICMDMYDVLDMCENAFQQGRFLDVLEVATYVLVSGVKLASYADSSSGMLTDVIMCTFELIGLCTQTIAKETMEMRTKAFSLIIKESKKKAFEGWSSWRYELIDKAICLCDEKMAMKFEKVLDVFLENDTDVYMPEYNKREDMILRYQLHRHIKGADAVKDELYANLHIEELRVIAVKDALNEKQYQEAERLCLEQIKDDDWRYYKNDPDDWNNILFDVFVQAGQIDKQVDQAKKILFLGNEEFWDVLKKLYQSQNAWETQRPILLEELKNSKHTTCYRSVLIEEDEKGLLLEAVSEKPIDLFYYSQFLVKEYPEEIYALCEDYIRGKCAEATDRRLYKKVCKDLLQLIKWKGNTTAKALVEEFKATYPRKPALLDELQKVEKKLVAK